jgi:hypothetical protein
MLDSEVIKYLKKYSIQDIELVYNSNSELTTAVIIPAIQEYENIKVLLLSLIKNDPHYFNNTLFVFVINNLSSSDFCIKEENNKSLLLLDSIVNKSSSETFIKNIIESGLNIGYIDASSPGKELPEKSGGVGLARKLGMDAAISIFNYGDKSKKLLICLDADCVVEKNYLTEIHNQFYANNIKAASINFEHRLTINDEYDSAIICYEIFLRNYVLGLKLAGSYYAFHTIGSSMACDHEIYIKTEGMNKKKAAEDFYFLEKISKHTPIFNIKNTKVYPSARKSWRVPFGTGQRVTRFHAKTHEEYLLYNPCIFELLKEWVAIFHSERILIAQEYLLQAKQISNGLYEFLELQDFSKNFNSILNSSKSAAQINLQKLRWFDGFRTLKLIHFLRDNYYPNINMFEALDIMFEKYNISPPECRKDAIPCMKTQTEYLERLRIIDNKY